MSAGQCQETTGFLFAHACERPAAHRCAVSNLPICETHAHEVAWADLEAAGIAPGAAPHASPTAVVSTTVARRLEQREQAAADAHRSPNRIVRSSGYRSRWHTDPFFYTYNRYDPWDFQQGDATSLRRTAVAGAGDAGEDDFEHDMQGS